MRRLLVLLSVLCLVVAACGDDDSADTTQATTATSEAVTTSEAPTTTEAATTTEAPATTEAATTTVDTTPPATVPVLDDPLLPDATHRTLIPWDEVDGSWALMLFANIYDYGNTEPPDEEAVVAYLVGPDGTPYEIAAWSENVGPVAILDVRPDGRQALLGFNTGIAPFGTDSFGLLDVVTGMMISGPDDWLSGVHATFTRPSGRDIVVHTHPDTIEMYRANGSTMASFGGWGGVATGYGVPMRPWLFAPTGVEMVINPPMGSTDAPRLFDNQGTFVRDLDTPGDECVALRWWSDTTVLMRCRNPYPGFWDVFTISIVDTTGVAETEVLTTTVGHTDPGEAGEGFVDAIRAGDDVMVQELLGVGSGAFPIARIGTDGVPVRLGESVQGQLIAAGPSTVTVHLLGCCGQVYGALTIYDHSGGEIATLDAPEGILGVTDAHGVGGM